MKLLDASMVAEIREQLTTINTHKRIVRALEHHLYSTIENTYGVDLAAGNWTLDLEHGMLIEQNKEEENG